MRMAQRDTDHLAAIFEDVHVLHIGQPAQLLRAVSPHLDQVANVIDGLLAER
jgi:hypothetical protein